MKVRVIYSTESKMFNYLNNGGEIFFDTIATKVKLEK